MKILFKISLVLVLVLHSTYSSLANLPPAYGDVINNTVPTPSVHNASIGIPETIDLNTDINVQQSITFDVSNYVQVTVLNLIVNDGNNVVLTNPVTDGIQTQNVTLSGISTSSIGSVDFQLSAIHAGGTAISNVMSVAIANLTGLAYFAVRSTNDFASVDTGLLTSADVISSGSVYSINLTVADGEVLGILSPTTRDPISIIDLLSVDVIGSFVLTNSVRIIHGVTYNLRSFVNNTGLPVIYNVVVTTE